MLIFADNASSETQVRLLLPGPGSHRVVVTSRHTLAGLNARLLDVAVLDEEAGAALLDRVLRIGRPDDDRISADRTNALRLAGICGGLPLALQITAALLNADPSLTVSDMVDELTDEVRRLKALRYDDGGGSSAPSVAAAFELSYRQLDEAAARVFRLLPVNPGPDISTAAVAALADLPIGDARKLISQLVKAHLAEAASGTVGQWRMHDLLRVYARQLSDIHADDGGREQARDRLLNYYLESSDAADDHLRALPGAPVPPRFNGQDSALAWLDEERRNLIAAVTMATNTGRYQIAQGLPIVLTEYLNWRRRFDDMISILMISRDAGRRLKDQQMEAEALCNLGIALSQLRRFDEAIAVCQDAVAIFRETGDRRGAGMALTNLGNALLLAGRMEEAITALREDLAICRETGDSHGAGLTLISLGNVMFKTHQSDEAITAGEEAAAIFHETGDRRHEGMALGNLGLALGDAGRLEEAIIACRDTAAIFRETGDRYEEGEALSGLGHVLGGDVGRLEETITAYREAATIFRETGDRYDEGIALSALGLALGEVGRLDEAITACRDTAAIFRETGDQHLEGEALSKLETWQAAQATEDNKGQVQQ